MLCITITSHHLTNHTFTNTSLIYFTNHKNSYLVTHTCTTSVHSYHPKGHKPTSINLDLNAHIIITIIILISFAHSSRQTKLKQQRQQQQQRQHPLLLISISISTISSYSSCSVSPITTTTSILHTPPIQQSTHSLTLPFYLQTIHCSPLSPLSPSSCSL